MNSTNKKRFVPRTEFRPKRENFIDVKDTLAIALRKFGLEKEIARYQFVLSWKEIVGEEIAKRSKPECIRGNALVVRVKDSIWAQELTFQKELILKRLKPYMNSDDIVEDVRFCVGAF